MDSIVSSALEEICSQGSGGLSLSSLWDRLSLPSPPVRASVWRNLLLIPALRFKSRNATWSSSDALIQCLEEAEKLALTIIADEKLRDSFVGLYGVQSNSVNISAVQRRVLERLAIARSNGVMQNQLAKEFGIEGKNLFYILRNLDSRGLIAKQPAVVRTKETGHEADSKSSSCVTTNMIYLSRYAKPLGSQQIFEVSKEGCPEEGPAKESEFGIGDDGLASGSGREDTLIKDYVPAMQAVCDKLQQVNGKVLVISDIKRDLGYTGSHSSHRAWRTVSRRLKEAHMVEEFEAKVNNKVERCLRLLKEFSQKDFEVTGIRSGCISEKHKQIQFGRRIQKFDQLVELPIDHQIYDMVDAKGSQGMAIMEVCDTLGIDKKRNYSRLCTLLSRFGMHIQAESHKKTTAFRVWTSGSICPQQVHPSSGNTKLVYDNKVSTSGQDSVDVTNSSAQKFLEYGCSTSESGFVNPEKSTEIGAYTQISHDLPLDDRISDIPICPQEPQKASHQTCNANEGETGMSANMGTVPPYSKCLTISNSPPRVSHSHPLTTDGALREQRILECLKNEKLVLRAELHRWLANLEREKGSKLDRKTIDRILNRLQQAGHCKCITINVPNVTNCGRNRSTLVVLHPSIKNLDPEIVGKIHEKIRAFEMETRGQGATKCKNNESVPVLNDVHRSRNPEDMDTRASRAETMRANGFVLAKMIRAKLLHFFLWDHLSSSPDWKDAYVHGERRQFSSFFSLETALKSMKLELFLQVVGSTLKFDDMIERCKKGWCLSDLPPQEYKLLMDTLATGRLSLLIDILRRLKLIRLMSSGQLSDAVEGRHPHLLHAMDLKPYIEEPLSVITTSIVASSDLRPRVRHDFILSNKQAVDEYWLTLEYCYAAADPRAAVQAFPGSAVHEVFLFRSWASIQVMTADQRAELIKRICKDDATERLSFKECQKIAKDLDLSVEQVLRAYRDKHQRRLNKFMASQSSMRKETAENKPSPFPRKGKRPRNIKSERSAADGSMASNSEQQVLPNDSSQNGEISLEDYDNVMMLHQDYDYPQVGDQKRLAIDESNFHLFANSSPPFKKKLTQLKRFCWTDEKDRQLVIKYAKYRAAAGAKFHRVDWTSIKELPAAPSVCKRRIAFLRRNKRCRKALMRLCSILCERYARYLETRQKEKLDNGNQQVNVQHSVGESLSGTVSDSFELEEDWDDFNEEVVKKALDGVLQLKQMAKSEGFKGAGFAHENRTKEFSKFEEHDTQELGDGSSKNNNEGLRWKSGGQLRNSGQRSRYQQLHQDLFRHLNEEASTARQVQDCLAVSNAVELLKLVFLSKTQSPDLPNMLEETLRCYSEHDLFAAYSYLRDEKILIGGSIGQPFVLSQQFLHNISKSPFPTNTGKRADEFYSWLLQREHDLLGGVNLHDDLQCGDVFSLLALVSSGEVSIHPFLPEEGVGEAEDSRVLKRRADDAEISEADKTKKIKLMMDGEVICRREKGFPGITVFVHGVSLPVAKAIDFFKEEKSHTSKLSFCGAFNSYLDNKSENLSDAENMEELCNVGPTTTIIGKPGESLWVTITRYAELLIVKCHQTQLGVLSPDVFEAVDTAIKKSGDRGLSMQEVSYFAGEMLCDVIVDVLQAFGQALKVNAYDSLRVVDAMYCSKYFLMSRVQSNLPLPLPFSSTSGGNSRENSGLGSHYNRETDSPRDMEVDAHGFHDVHKVTILNLPDEDALHANEINPRTAQEGRAQSERASAGRGCGSEFNSFSGVKSCSPILPWINADGSINEIVFAGLKRRMLGTVMQSPGILEDEIIRRMDVLNPQSCRTLLELMTLDGHLTVRHMHQTRYSGPPALLGTLLRNSSRKLENLHRRHFFANLKSAHLL